MQIMQGPFLLYRSRSMSSLELAHDRTYRFSSIQIWRETSLQRSEEFTRLQGGAMSSNSAPLLLHADTDMRFTQHRHLKPTSPRFCSGGRGEQSRRNAALQAVSCRSFNYVMHTREPEEFPGLLALLRSDRRIVVRGRQTAARFRCNTSQPADSRALSQPYGGKRLSPTTSCQPRPLVRFRTPFHTYLDDHVSIFGCCCPQRHHAHVQPNERRARAELLVRPA